MIAAMENYGQESRFRKWWNGLDFLHKRLIRMFLSLLVMVLCFPLYYLGLFGSCGGAAQSGANRRLSGRAWA